jgi:hypothetical protein
MDGITDIWFYTELPLTGLGEALGLSDIDHDGENYWEWIIGNLAGVALDISRTHTAPAAATPTTIFRLNEHQAFTSDMINVLVPRIQAVGITPIMLGSWIYRSGNDFDLRVDRTIT